MSADRLNILVIARACDPFRGSEAGVGWGIVESLSEFADTTVLVASSHISAVFRYLETSPPPTGATFVEVKEVWWARFTRWHRLVRFPNYLAWLRRVRVVAGELAATGDFDAVHHATFSSYWTPSPVTEIGLPTVVGPLGGAVKTPRSLWPALGVRGLLNEFLDAVAVRVMEWLPSVRRTWRKADCVIAQNDQTADRLRLGGVDDVMIFNHTLFIAPPPKTSEKARSGVLWLGPLETRKGAALAVRAMAKTAPDLHMTVVGDGPDRKRLEQLAEKLGVADRVRFLGRIPHDDVFSHISSASVAVFTGLREEGGVSLTEVMFMGTPVVVVANGGAKTIADATVDPRFVRLVEPGSVDETTSALAAAITDCMRSNEAPGGSLLDRGAAIETMRRVFLRAIAAADNAA